MTFLEFVEAEGYGFSDLEDRTMRIAAVARAIEVRLLSRTGNEGRGRGHILLTRGKRRLVDALEAHDVPHHVHGDVAEATFKDMGIEFPVDRMGHHLRARRFTTARAEQAAAQRCHLTPEERTWGPCAMSANDAKPDGHPIQIRDGEAGRDQLEALVEDAATLMQGALEHPGSQFKQTLSIHVERADSLASFAVHDEAAALVGFRRIDGANLWARDAANERVAHALDHAIAHFRPTCLWEKGITDRVAAKAEIEPVPASETLKAVLSPRKAKAAARIRSFLVRTGAEPDLVAMFDPAMRDPAGTLDTRDAAP